MRMSRAWSGSGSLVEVCHQIPGRTRLRVPLLRTLGDADAPVAAALRGLDGVHAVRLNRRCASIVLFHSPQLTLSEDQLQRTLWPILRPLIAACAPSRRRRRADQAARQVPVATHQAALGSQAPGVLNRQVRQEQRAKPSVGVAAASCLFCQLKLKAARWILADVWRCWRDQWLARLHGRVTASLALLRP